jgi:hypothetical protein
LEPRPALPFTAAGRLERQTARAANTIASSTYLEVLAADGRAAVERTKVRGVLAVEREGAVGAARLGNDISNELANSSALAQQLVSEVLIGTSGRIQQVLNDAARRIGNQ